MPAAAVQSPELESFRAALKTYIDQTQPHRKEAAAKGEAVPNQTSAGGADEAVRVRQRTMAEAIQITVRPAAQQGDILSSAMADLIRRQLATAFGGPKADIIRDGLQEQNEGLEAESIMVAELAGDRMFFQAITTQGRTLDCGVFWRTSDAAAKPQDSTTLAWQDACRAATMWRAPGMTGHR